MKLLKYILILSVSTPLLFSSCKNKEFDENRFAESTPDGKPCLSINNIKIIEYNADKHQVGFNDKKNEFRVSDDMMETYFVIRLERMPSSEDEFISSEIEYVINGVKHANSGNFKVIRLAENGRKIWLWNQESKTGAIVMDLSKN